MTDKLTEILQRQLGDCRRELAARNDTLTKILEALDRGNDAVKAVIQEMDR